jgi:hypothetical protein
MSAAGSRWDPATFESLLKTSLDPTLRGVTAELGVMLLIHRIDKQPPGLDKTFATYTIKVGYALQDQRTLIARIASGLKSSQMIPVEISVNEPICADETIELVASKRLRVCTVEDIVAEKLRALLQQPIRNRQRRQDLLDIAILLTEHLNLDPIRITDFLQRKAAARGVPVSRGAFRNLDVLERAHVDYDVLETTTRNVFVSYDEACAIVLAFTDSLPIPEHIQSSI